MGRKKRQQLKEETVGEHYTGLLGVQEPWRVSEVTREPEVERARGSPVQAFRWR